MRRGAKFLVWLIAWVAALSGFALSESLLCVSVDGVAALLNGAGAEIIPPGEYDDVFCVTEGGRYAVGRETGEGLRYALCDADGNLLTDFLYGMFDVGEDFILFRQDSRYGVMDMDGRVLIAAQYTQLAETGGGRFLALATDPNDDEPDAVWLIGLDGEAVSTGVTTACGLSAVQSDRMPFRAPDAERCGYLDGSGAVAIPAELSYAGPFENGFARAAINGKFGLLQPDGEWLIAPEYDFLEVGEGIAAAMTDGGDCVVFALPNGVERFRVEGERLEVGVLGSRLMALDAQNLRVYEPDGSLLLATDRSASVSQGAGGQLILREGDWGAKCVSIVDENGDQHQRRDQHLLPLDDDRYLFMEMNVAVYNSDTLGQIRYSCDYDSMRFGIMTAAGAEILPAAAMEIQRLGEYRYLIVSEDGLRVVDGSGVVLWSELVETE